MGTLLNLQVNLISAMFRLLVLSAFIAAAVAVGSWGEVDSNDEEYLGLLEEVYYPGSIGKENLNLIKIERQIVSGINLKYTFTVGKTNSVCHVIIYHQSWTETKVVKEDTCAF